MSRYALIVGVAEYATGLHSLPSSARDVQAVRRILRDYGDFLDENIVVLTDPNTDEFREKLGRLFVQRKPDELVLFYYSGHGLTNPAGTRAYLCSRLTETNSLGASSIASDYLANLMEDCRARQVVILDCCFSSTVAKNIKLDRHAVILASSDTLEYSRASDGLSLYTQHWVTGIETGATVRDGIIHAAPLHEYVASKVAAEQPDMNPQIWPFRDGYRLPVAYARQQKAASVPEMPAQTPLPHAPRSPEVQAYLEGILYEADEFRQRYIDLSATTIQTKTALPDKFNWSRDLIPSAFKAIDKRLNPKHAEPKLLDSISDAFALHTRFVLLGAPGCGKSTSLKKLLLDSADKAMQDPVAAAPILINLAEWPDEIKHIPGLIQLGLQTSGLPPIHVNRLLILLDGLNEVSAQHYVERVKLLDEWLKLNPKASVVISCRENHYQNSKQLAIPSVHIEPFDNQRIQLFLNAYLGSQAAQEILPQLGALQPELRSPRDLIHLADNPFFLAMICYVYVSRQYLPNSRGQLFQLFVDTLYDREEEKKTTQGLSQKEFIYGLSAVAFAMQKKRSATSVHTVWAEKQVPKNMPVQSLWDLGRESRLLQLVKEGRVFQFTHQLILEYFAAEGLLQRYSRLSDYIGKPGFARKQRKSGAWDEVVFTLAGITEPNTLLTALAQTDPFLAVDCFEHIPKESQLTEKTISFITQSLIQFFDSHAQEIRTAAVNKLVQVGEAVIPYFTKLLRSSDNQVIKRACLETLAKFNHPDALQAIAWALLDKNRWVRKDASDLLANYTELLKPLVDNLVILYKQHNKQAGELIFGLYKGGHISSIYEFSYDEPVEELHSIFALNDENAAVRAAAIQALQKSGYAGLAGKVLPALNDESPKVRMAAIYALQQSGYEGLAENILSALNDESPKVRAAAIYALQQSGCESLAENILSALNDESPKVRVAVIKVLQKSGYAGLAEKVLPALNDENPTVRMAAIQALQKFGYAGLAEKILPALNDKSVAVRSVVILALQKSGYAGLAEKILPDLNNKYADVRMAAIQALLESGYEAQTEKLLPLLDDSNVYIRIGAASILLKLKPNLLTQEIKIAFYDEVHRFIPNLVMLTKKYQIILFHALSQLNDMELVRHYLVPKLKDTDALLRRAAVIVLGKTKNSEFREDLLPLLEDASPMVRETAKEALRKM